MKLLQTAVFIMAGLLAGTACQRTPPKPENDRAGAVQPLDPIVQNLNKQLSLTEEQIQQLNTITQETRTKRDVITQQLRDLYKKRQEQVNAVLTQEQLKKYEQKRWKLPEHPGKPEQSAP